MPRILLASLALGLAVAACGSSGSIPAPTPLVGSEIRTYLQVENLTFADLSITVRSESLHQEQRVGRSRGNSTETFVIPNGFVGTGSLLRFILDPIGITRPAITHEVRVTPGDTVFLRIPPF